GDPLRKLAAVGPVRQNRDVRGEARAGVSADEQQMIRTAEPLERAEQHRHVLFLAEAAGIDEDAGVARDSDALAEVRQRPARMKHVRVDAERLMQYTGHADIEEIAAREPAR